jgi:hypothetical protein
MVVFRVHFKVSKIVDNNNNSNNNNNNNTLIT